MLNGDVASGIGKTYELVQQGYADFEAAQSSRIGSAQSVTAENASSTAKAGL